MERLAFNTPRAVVPTTAPAPVRPARGGGGDEAGGANDEGLERLDRWAFTGLLAFTLVLFFRPQDQLPFLRPLHLADITAGFAILCLFTGRLARGLAPTRTTPELVLVFAMAAVMAATIPFSLWPGGAFTVLFDVFLKVVLIFTLIVNTITTHRRFERFVTIVVTGTTYVAVRTVVDYARGLNLVEGGRASGAVGGLFGNPNDMALNMVSFLPLAIVLVLGRGRTLWRAVGLIGIPAMMLAIIASKSRGGVVGLIAMLAVLLFQMRRLRPGLAALVLAVGIAGLPLLPESFTARMSSIFDSDQDATGSREARKRLLREGVEAAIENPLFGLGAGQFQNYKPAERDEPWRETHNAALQVAAELGIAGLAVFLGLIWTAFAGVRRTSRLLQAPARRAQERRVRRLELARLEPLQLHAAALAACLTGWFVAAMFASVAYYWTFYILLGLSAAFRDIGMRGAWTAAPSTGAKRTRAAA